MSERPDAVIVDLDGTLCDIGTRHPYHGHLCDTDIPHNAVLSLVNSLSRDEVAIILLSGRNEDARTATVKWLKDYGVSWDRLYLRATDDWSPAESYKWGVYESVIAPAWNVLFMVEDHLPTARLFRERGVPVLTYAEREDNTIHESSG